jgi:hypothetical protein
MAKRHLFSRLLLLAAGTLALRAMGPQSVPGNDDPRIWIGEIKIVRTGAGHQREDHSTDQLKDIRSTDKEAEEKITIKVCGAFGELYVKDMDWTLKENTHTERTTQHARTRCDFPKEAYDHNLLYRLKNYKQEVKEPGDSSTQSRQFLRDLYQGKDSRPPKKMSSVTLNKLPGQELTLRVSCGGYVALTDDDVTRSWHACSGQTEVREFHQRTAKAIGQEATTTLNETGEGDSKHTVLDQAIPPIPLQSGFMADIQIDGDSISGSQVVGEMLPEHPGDYQEKTTAYWDLTAKDPCREVYDDLINDLAYGEAYADKNIQDFAGSIRDFEKMVDDRAFKTIYGRPAPRDEEDLSVTGLGVNPETCELEGKDEYKEKMARECRPHIIVEATMAHEGVHERQCKKFHEEMNSGKPQIKGLMETTAYIKSAGMLINWLEKNCPDIDLRNEKTRLEKLKSAKASRY